MAAASWSILRSWYTRWRKSIVIDFAEQLLFSRRWQTVKTRTAAMAAVVIIIIAKVKEVVAVIIATTTATTTTKITATTDASSCYEKIPNRRSRRNSLTSAPRTITNRRIQWMKGICSSSSKHFWRKRRRKLHHSRDEEAAKRKKPWRSARDGSATLLLPHFTSKCIVAAIITRRHWPLQSIGSYLLLYWDKWNY